MSILVDADTTFIVQGITGREAVNLTRECIDYGAGAKIVGGVTPGRLGREVHGVPVFDTVQQAVEHHGAAIKGSVVTVPPAFTKDAVFEAIASELQNGGEVAVSGFGKFSVSDRSAREGRNPATGETIQIAASKAAKFSAASALKKQLNG